MTNPNLPARIARTIDRIRDDSMERRADMRRRVLKAAALTFFGGYRTREGIARSLSQNAVIFRGMRTLFEG
jgi:hypothetical protein